MKPYLLFALIYLNSSWLLAHPAINMANDTTTWYVDNFGRQQPEVNATFIQKSWPEGGRYKLHKYTNDAQKKLVGFAWYADSNLQVLDGPFENYYLNGNLKDSGSFQNKKRQGTHKSWYEDGALNSIRHYENGIMVDTGKVFFNDGKLMNLSVTDKVGNGFRTEYYPDGSIHQTGPLAGGVKNGTWTIKRPDGTNLMQVDFMRDSLTQATCFAEDGTTRLQGPCVYEKFASFPGNSEGWRSYLTKNLKYPKLAIQQDIQGTVMLEFVVELDGTVGDIKVLSSPHELLTNESLRLMKISPNWEPAIQYNKTVKGRLRQPFFFRLE
jgi:TonB family protein